MKQEPGRQQPGIPSLQGGEEVKHPAKGWTRVGNAYPSRKAAADWLPFVRGAWRGLRAKVSQCTVRLDGGKVCEQSRRLLDEKYNLDA